MAREQDDYKAMQAETARSRRAYLDAKDENIERRPIMQADGERMLKSKSVGLFPRIRADRDIVTALQELHSILDTLAPQKRRSVQIRSRIIVNKPTMPSLISARQR